MITGAAGCRSGCSSACWATPICRVYAASCWLRGTPTGYTIGSGSPRWMTRRGSWRSSALASSSRPLPGQRHQSEGCQDMAIRVCVAGVSGWTGSEITRAILASTEFELAGAVARRHAGRDAGEVLGLPASGVVVAGTLGEALARPADVLVDYTSPDS